MSRLQGNWNFTEVETIQGSKQTHWQMPWLLLNIMMLFLVQKSSMWLMIMQKDCLSDIKRWKITWTLTFCSSLWSELYLLVYHHRAGWESCWIFTCMLGWDNIAVWMWEVTYKVPTGKTHFHKFISYLQFIAWF